MSITQSSKTASAFKTCFYIFLGALVALASTFAGLATASSPVYVRVGNVTLISHHGLATAEGSYYTDSQYVSSTYEAIQPVMRPGMQNPCRTGKEALALMSEEPTWQIITLHIANDGLMHLVVNKQSDYERAQASRKEYMDYTSYCVSLPLQSGPPILSVNPDTRELKIVH